jgi:FkbM family methyltransferase
MNIYRFPLIGRLTAHVVMKQPRFRTLLTRILVPDREKDLSLFGAKVRANSRKEIGYFRTENAVNSAHLLRDEVPTLISLALILKSDDTFVDVGANVGIFSAVMSRMAALNPSFRIYAFEPNPDTAVRLRATLSGTKAVIHQCALYDKDTELTFSSGVTSGVFKQSAEGSTVLTARRLDSFPIDGKEIVLKIDVEGLEREVLDGASGLLPRCRAIMIDGYLDKTIPDFLRKRGFEIFEAWTLKREDNPWRLLALRKSGMDYP